MFLAAAVVAALVTGCASPRYVGSLGRDGTYINRGYGFVLRLNDGGLTERWDVIDPSNTAAAATGARPLKVDSPLDLDGDGLLQVTERTLHYRPTLRILSRTSTTTQINLDVYILGGSSKTVDLAALLPYEAGRVTRTSSTAIAGRMSEPEIFKAPPSYAGRRAEIAPAPGSNAYIVALIDHTDFRSEEGIERRQVVRIVLTAPNISDKLRADFDLVLKNLILNRRADFESTQEKW